MCRPPSSDKNCCRKRSARDHDCGLRRPCMYAAPAAKVSFVLCNAMNPTDEAGGPGEGFSGPAFFVSFPPLNKGRYGCGGLGLLIRGADLRRGVTLLRTVIAELGVVAALDLHHVFGVVDFVLHALI